MLTLRIAPSGKQQQIQAYNPDWTKKGAPVKLDVAGEAPVAYAVGQGAAAIVEIR